MSVENETAGAHAASRAEAEVEPATPAPNPVPLGLITFIPGGIILGLWFVGYLDTTALPGGMIPIVTFTTGLFMLIAAVWAAMNAVNTVAAIFGLFSGFWISFGILLLALNNGWIVNAATTQAINATQVANIQAAFLLSWTITFILMTLATLRLPLAFTVGFVFVDVTFVLAYLGVALGNAGLFPIAGITTFIFTAIFAYVVFSEFGADLGGKQLAMGNPIQK